MLKRYEELEIKIICLSNTDVVTASGDNYENDPWVGFEY